MKALEKLTHHHLQEEKKKDPTSEFREYMLNRTARQERRNKILMWLLIFVALVLALFILLSVMCDRS